MNNQQLSPRLERAWETERENKEVESLYGGNEHDCRRSICSIKKRATSRHGNWSTNPLCSTTKTRQVISKGGGLDDN